MKERVTSDQARAAIEEGGGDCSCLGCLACADLLDARKVIEAADVLSMEADCCICNKAIATAARAYDAVRGTR